MRNRTFLLRLGNELWYRASIAHADGSALRMPRPRYSFASQTHKKAVSTTREQRRRLATKAQAGRERLPVGSSSGAPMRRSATTALAEDICAITPVRCRIESLGCGKQSEGSRG
jgi:hypothetical protein